MCKDFTSLSHLSVADSTFLGAAAAHEYTLVQLRDMHSRRRYSKALHVKTLSRIEVQAQASTR